MKSHFLFSLVMGLLITTITVSSSCGASPLTLKDDEIGFIYFVETDRQHVSAIDEEGNIHWNLDVADIPAIRPLAGDILIEKISEAPRSSLHALGKDPSSNDYLLVMFNTGEIGLIHRRTARYSSLGR